MLADPSRATAAWLQAHLDRPPVSSRPAGLAVEALAVETVGERLGPARGGRDGDVGPGRLQVAAAYSLPWFTRRDSADALSTRSEYRSVSSSERPRTMYVNRTSSSHTSTIRS